MSQHDVTFQHKKRYNSGTNELSKVKLGENYLRAEITVRQFFTALHEMQRRSSDENSVRPSICLCLSVKCVNCDKTEEKSVNFYRRGVIAFFLRFFSPNLIALLAIYVTVVEDRPIMSVKYCLPVSLLLLAITNPSCSAISLR